MEVADKDYGQFRVPGDDVPKGHFYVRPVFNKQSAWVFEVVPKQKLRRVRKQAWGAKISCNRFLHLFGSLVYIISVVFVCLCLLVSLTRRCPWLHSER